MDDVTGITGRPLGTSREIAVERVVHFAQRFGEAHLTLACHAAFPLTLTPDLLYYIWAIFLPQSPWTAVADILLSRLCREVAPELYEMDGAVRKLLLQELQEDERFGRKRLDELADFLIGYVAQQIHSDDPDVSSLAEAQQWTALAYTRPGEAARGLAERLAEVVQATEAGDKFGGGLELLRLGSLVETLSEPLNEFAPLVAYVRGLSSYVRGNQEEAKAHLGQLFASGEEVGVAGITLPLPSRLASLLQRVRGETDLLGRVEERGRARDWAGALALVEEARQQLGDQVPVAVWGLDAQLRDVDKMLRQAYVEAPEAYAQAQAAYESGGATRQFGAVLPLLTAAEQLLTAAARATEDRLPLDLETLQNQVRALRQRVELALRALALYETDLYSAVMTLRAGLLERDDPVLRRLLESLEGEFEEQRDWGAAEYLQRAREASDQGLFTEALEAITKARGYRATDEIGALYRQIVQREGLLKQLRDADSSCQDRLSGGDLIEAANALRRALYALLEPVAELPDRARAALGKLLELADKEMPLVELDRTRSEVEALLQEVGQASGSWAAARAFYFADQWVKLRREIDIRSIMISATQVGNLLEAYRAVVRLLRTRPTDFKVQQEHTEAQDRLRNRLNESARKRLAWAEESLKQGNFAEVLRDLQTLDDQLYGPVDAEFPGMLDSFPDVVDLRAQARVARRRGEQVQEIHQRTQPLLNAVREAYYEGQLDVAARKLRQLESQAGLEETPDLAAAAADLRRLVGYTQFGSMTEKLTVGQTISLGGTAYTLVAFLGGGAIAEVYQATAPELPGEVVFKVAQQDAARAEEGRLKIAGIQTEGRVLAILNQAEDPSCDRLTTVVERMQRAQQTVAQRLVVALLDQGEIELGQPYLVQELAPPEFERFDVQTMVDERRMLKVVLAFVRVMALAHRHNLALKDMDPQYKINRLRVRWLDEEDNLEFKLIDWNITGGPEDFAQDLLFLGGMCYYLLLGRHVNLKSLPTNLGLDIPEQWCRLTAGSRMLLSRLLHRVPERRYRRADDVESDVAWWLDVMVQVGAPGVAERLLDQIWPARAQGLHDRVLAIAELAQHLNLPAQFRQTFEVSAKNSQQEIDNALWLPIAEALSLLQNGSFAAATDRLTTQLRQQDERSEVARIARVRLLQALAGPQLQQASAGADVRVLPEWAAVSRAADQLIQRQWEEAGTALDELVRVIPAAQEWLPVRDMRSLAEAGLLLEQASILRYQAEPRTADAERPDWEGKEKGNLGLLEEAVRLLGEAARKAPHEPEFQDQLAAAQSGLEQRRSELLRHQDARQLQQQTAASSRQTNGLGLDQAPTRLLEESVPSEAGHVEPAEAVTRSGKGLLYAVVSDIHANLQALEAVIADAQIVAKHEGLELHLICLGDVVDNGPQPNECMDWLCRHPGVITVQGNHDAAASDPFYRSPSLRSIAPEWWPITLWTRRELEPVYRTTLGGWSPYLHTTNELDRFVCFHGSLVGGHGVYVDQAAQAQAEMAEMEHRNHVYRWNIDYGLLGGSHIQGYFCERTQGPPQFFLACADDRYPEELSCRPQPAERYRNGAILRPAGGTVERDCRPVPASVGSSNIWQRLLPSWKKALFDPGSVGRPRTHAALFGGETYNDWRAAYMLLRVRKHGEVQFQFRRVEYDVELTKRLLQERVRWRQGNSDLSIFKDISVFPENPDEEAVRVRLPTIAAELEALVHDHLIPTLGRI